MLTCITHAYCGKIICDILKFFGYACASNERAQDFLRNHCKHACDCLPITFNHSSCAWKRTYKHQIEDGVLFCTYNLLIREDRFEQVRLLVPPRKDSHNHILCLLIICKHKKRDGCRQRWWILLLLAQCTSFSLSSNAHARELRAFIGIQHLPFLLMHSET